MPDAPGGKESYSLINTRFYRFSSTPHLSYYAVGVVGLLFWAALLSAPFAALLLYLNSEGISREFRKMSHLNSVSDQFSGTPDSRLIKAAARTGRRP